MERKGYICCGNAGFVMSGEAVKDFEMGSVINFVFLVINVSFLVRIEICQFISKRRFIYVDSKGTNCIPPIS